MHVLQEAEIRHAVRGDSDSPLTHHPYYLYMTLQLALSAWILLSFSISIQGPNVFVIGFYMFVEVKCSVKD